MQLPCNARNASGTENGFLAVPSRSQPSEDIFAKASNSSCSTTILFYINRPPILTLQTTKSSYVVEDSEKLKSVFSKYDNRLGELMDKMNRQHEELAAGLTELSKFHDLLLEKFGFDTTAYFDRKNNNRCPVNAGQTLAAQKRNASTKSQLNKNRKRNKNKRSSGVETQREGVHLNDDTPIVLDHI